jgi:hypothetical protein
MCVLLLAVVLVFATPSSDARGGDARGGESGRLVLVAQQEPGQPKGPPQTSPSDLPVPPTQNGPGAEDRPAVEQPPNVCAARSPCRPVRRFCRPLLGLLRRCR